MGITSTLYTALSGLNASQVRLDVSGTNIANVNTTGYKGSRTTFKTQLSRTMSLGTPPTDESGGSNPMQFGLGVDVGAVDRDFSSGSIELTGIKSQIMIDGAGFFVLQNADGSRTFTRDGSFNLDENQKLVSASGQLVLGYPIDETFNLVTGTAAPLEVPEGTLSIVEATSWTSFEGNLDPTGDVSTVPGQVTSIELINSGGGTPIVGTTALTTVAKAADPATTLFSAGDVITLTATRGGADIPTSTFTVTAAATSGIDSGATVDELREWAQARLGIDTTVTQTPAGGVDITGTGEFQITSNLGPGSEIDTITLTSDAGAAITFSTNSSEVDGASSSTSFRIYDSLGGPIDVNLTFSLIDKTSVGNTWRFYATSYDSTDSSPVVGTGTLTFDTSGALSDTTGTAITINRTDTGAADPVVCDLNFTALQGLQRAQGESAVNMVAQDGFPMGTLNDYGVAGDGTIVGTFSNGLTRTMGQVVLATFSNPEGLIATGDNGFLAGPNSGEATIVAPGGRGSGQLVGGALELSNVDMTREFINMITATTAFSAAGRVISTSQQLLSELLTVVR